jgi:NAD+ synthase
MHIRAEEIAAWLRQRVTAAGAEGLVVGLSGGVDSAVVARLCQLAMPEHAIAVLMPCRSDPRDEADARLVAERFTLPIVRVNLESAYERLAVDLQAALAQVPARSLPTAPRDQTDLRARVPLANVKPRLRMATLYFLSNSLNYLVAGTGNRCELTIGYFTKHGDGGVDLLPLGNLLKSDVLALARDLDVPEQVIDKPPSAGLWLGQTDESEMGFTYSELERYLEEGPDAVSPAVALRIERLERYSEHKRSLPPMPDTE